ncbi:hypothetical protein JX265_001524 [Neoarthrinium moseri]|uniref:Glycosyl transferase CAP10 domain-containing protein n=1 Tax=Neoarthrinium moseri TaxID=1658444 RepID=A0A9Q0AUP2_9PEZI|nr:hypothetical protein JX265_001524 [Neoarthrinium moseri]
MAGDGGSRLAGVCFLASFMWLYYSLDKQFLTERPRLSACLVLLVSGAVAFGLSFFSKRLPGADGRFDSEAVFKGMKSSLPQRPRRFYVPCIILLIVVRLEVLYSVVHDFQCTAHGIEAFLPLLLALHEFFFNQKVPPPVQSDEPEDPWGDCWEDVLDWIKHSHLTLLLGTSIFTYGVFSASQFATRSSYICSTYSDSASWITFLQWAGVFMDATIIVLLWRVFSWARTTKGRLRTLSAILAVSSTATGVLWLSTRIVQRRSIFNAQSNLGLDSIFIFDILSHGITCAILAVSAALWMSDSPPLPLAGTTTFVCSSIAASREVLRYGTYLQTSKIQPLVALSFISAGYVIFTFACNMRSIMYIRRIFLLLLIIALVITATVKALLRNPIMKQHHVNELIYESRVETDRWLRYAATSDTITAAVSEYKERHNGRDPPANYDKWFEFALQRKSAIIDKFDQIDKDVLPFWGMKPSKIQEGLEVVKALPDVGIIKIVDGKAYHNQPADPLQRLILDDAVSMISSFSQHLPEMSIAINLQERPRILVPWEDINRLKQAGTKSKLKLLSRAIDPRQADDSKPLENSGGSAFKAAPKSTARPYVTTKDFHHLQALACPPGSKIRAGVSWNVRDHCASCAEHHSRGPVVLDWWHSLDVCYQPDVFHLHDFHTIPHRYELYQDLLPLFSRSKTDSFNDIIVPLIRSNVSHEPDTKAFHTKEEKLIWQQEPEEQPVTHQSLHGGHRNRLVHLINQASDSLKQSLIISTKSGKETRYVYEQVRTSEMNQILPMEVSYIFPEKCDGPSCQMVQSENLPMRPRQDALNNRYVMLLDTADGPSPDTLSLIRANSVPFISTIFREWYTDRIMPWSHFVPIDIRYHGLHNTLAYFTGLTGRGKINGRQPLMQQRMDDGRWISEQGRKWADKVLRREDMEIYWFRLLLEWGRVISEDRDNMKFTLKQGS